MHLTELGKSVELNGSPEYLMWRLLQDHDYLSLEQLSDMLGEKTAKLGLSAAMRNKWIHLLLGRGIHSCADNVVDEVREIICHPSPKVRFDNMNMLKARRLVEKVNGCYECGENVCW